KLARLKAEEEVKKRERVCEEGKKLEQRYTTLLNVEGTQENLVWLMIEKLLKF
ncbi:hypothetical protein A2U01_0070786, partial [Trifolium medium]|nr:hypothetical protein [Trifolium medium]